MKVVPDMWRMNAVLDIFTSFLVRRAPSEASTKLEQ
jgi:hypothetical protein